MIAISQVLKHMLFCGIAYILSVVLIVGITGLLFCLYMLWRIYQLDKLFKSLPVDDKAWLVDHLDLVLNDWKVININHAYYRHRWEHLKS